MRRFCHHKSRRRRCRAPEVAAFSIAKRGRWIQIIVRVLTETARIANSREAASDRKNFRVIQEIAVAESIFGDKFATRCRINVLTAQAQTLLSCLKHTALDTVRHTPSSLEHCLVLKENYVCTIFRSLDHWSRRWSVCYRLPNWNNHRCRNLRAQTVRI